MRATALKLLALLAVMLMPLGMAASPAAAHHQPAAAMPMEHCPEPEPAHTTRSGFVDCTMACSAALPAVGSSIPMQPLILCTKSYFVCHFSQPVRKLYPDGVR